MLRQAVQGNPYFLKRGVVILRHNMKEPAFAPLLAALQSGLSIGKVSWRMCKI
jgi:hypothetical protein